MLIIKEKIVFLQKTREIIDNVERVLIYSFGSAFIESKGNIVGVYTVPGETSDKVSYRLEYGFLCIVKAFMKYLKEYIRTCDKLRDIISQSVAWMIISLVAAYPQLCLHFDTSVFTTTTRDDYCNKFLLPIMLFLLAFIFDFFFSIKDLSIGQKRGSLFKCFTILICLMVFIFCLITVIPCIHLKIALFFLLWADICLIKGLTVLIPGEEELVELSVPVNTYEKK